MALGLTQQVPLDDRHSYTREYIQNSLTIRFGGRAAEELVLGHVTTGAADDIEKATDWARKMVCEWGMSETMGPLQFGKREEMVFLGREIAQHQDYSEHTAMEIDREVRRIVMENFERAKDLVQRRLETLHHLAVALLEREVLDGPEIDGIVKRAVSPTPAAA
jgi:cell division protease FtsH